MTYLAWLLVVGAACLAVFYARRYFAIQGERLVTCPENQHPAAVDVSSAWAALGGNWRLADCSRWPEQRSCGRECLAQIEKSPEDCLVRNVVAAWYHDKDCAVCQKPLGHIDWHERKPAMMDARGVARPWPDVAAETLPDVLATSRPVCFDCYVAETFRREHPELVIDNPWVRQ